MAGKINDSNRTMAVRRGRESQAAPASRIQERMIVINTAGDSIYNYFIYNKGGNERRTGVEPDRK